MGKRYGRSNGLKFKKRRQRTGFVVFVSVIAIMLGGLLFFGVESAQRTAGERLVQRPETPTVDRAPEAAADTMTDAEKEEQAAEPETVEVPDIPYNATEQEAEDLLESKGLELGEVQQEHNDEYDKGGVFFQDPLPEVEVKEGSSVGITLSSGPDEEAEQAAAEDPPDPATDDLYLSIPKIGKYEEYVVNDASESSMLNGPGKITETGFPWQESANTYIASHVYGYEGTGSWQDFAALPSLTYGDEVILSDANGTKYVYQVSNIVTVSPTDTWITEPVTGKDMVSLQTCVGPGWTERFVVQAERVDVTPA